MKSIDVLRFPDMFLYFPIALASTNAKQWRTCIQHVDIRKPMTQNNIAHVEVHRPLLNITLPSAVSSEIKMT